MLKPATLFALIIAAASCANSEQQQIAYSGRVWPMDVTAGADGCAETGAPGQCGKNSDIPACHAQFRNDEKRCQKAKIIQCWETAMERLGYCNKTGGQVGWPPLITKLPR